MGRELERRWITGKKKNPAGLVGEQGSKIRDL
jgi:hypothetical protein